MDNGNSVLDAAWVSRKDPIVVAAIRARLRAGATSLVLSDLPMEASDLAALADAVATAPSMRSLEVSQTGFYQDDYEWDTTKDSNDPPRTTRAWHWDRLTVKEGMGRQSRDLGRCLRAPTNSICMAIMSDRKVRRRWPEYLKTPIQRCNRCSWPTMRSASTEHLRSPPLCIGIAPLLLSTSTIHILGEYQTTTTHTYRVGWGRTARRH